jgi:purine-binding chemotaxis protein CheW
MQDATVRSLCCRVHGRLAAIALSHVIETMRPLAIQPMTRSPAFVLGVSMIRGQPVPVVDLGLLLAGRISSPSRYVTLRVENRAVALAVEEVVGVMTVTEESLAQMPPLLRDSGAELVSAIGSLDAELLIVLNAARVFPESLLSETEAVT